MNYCKSIRQMAEQTAQQHRYAGYERTSYYREPGNKRSIYIAAWHSKIYCLYN